MTSELNNANFNIFRDCLSGPLIARSAETPSKTQKRRKHKGRKHAEITPPSQALDAVGDTEDAEDLAEFIDVGLSMPHEMISKLNSRST